MNELEDSTLDLIHRRRVRSNYPGYMILFIAVGTIAVLPLVKVDVTATMRGMVRPLDEPVTISCPVNGILDSTILRNNLRVRSGDTLAWIERDHLEARMESHMSIIQENLGLIQDIHNILEDRMPRKTSRYRQSYRNHLSGLTHLQLKEEFLSNEFRIAEQLYREEVIPLHDYQRAESDYRIVVAEISGMKERYRKAVEDELFTLQREMEHSDTEVKLIRSRMRDYFIVAPLSGTVYNCPGISAGSVIQTGTSLGIISASEPLVAECYLDPANITVVKNGSRVRLKFDDGGFRAPKYHEVRVDHIDEDIVLVNGNPAFRIRCNLDHHMILYADGSADPLRSGMTFTANIMLIRQSLMAIFLKKLNQWANPALSTRSVEQ